MGISNQEKQYGNHFQLSSQEFWNQNYEEKNKFPMKNLWQ